MKAGLQQQVSQPKKQIQKTKHAENENDAINIDLAFVKSQHAPNQKLLAVSGSYRKLKAPPSASNDDWAGLVYNEENLNYEQATNKYIEKNNPKEKTKKTCIKESESIKAERKKINEQIEDLRIQCHL